MLSRTVQGITRSSYRTPMSRTTAPMAGTAIPLRRNPDHACALDFPTAAHPDVLAPVPVPVARDPEVAGAWLRRRHLASRRRRRHGDGNFGGRRVDGRRRRGRPISGRKHPFATLAAPAALD